MAGQASLATPVRQTGFRSRLTDEKKMRSILQRELAPLSDTPIRITACRIQPTVLPTSPRRRTRLVYRLTVRGPAGRVWEHTLVATFPVPPDFLSPELMYRCRAAAKHPMAEPFNQLAFYLDDLEMAAVLLPIDPALPGLAAITGREGAGLLSRHLVECRKGAKIAEVRREFCRYRPWRSCVLRLATSLAGSNGRPNGRIVYVKIFADDRGEMHDHNLRAVWPVASRAKQLKTPEPLGYDEEHRLLFMSEARGGDELARWIRQLERDEPLPAGADPARFMQIAAEALVELQDSGLDPAQERTFRGELAHLHRNVERLRVRLPRLAGEIDRVLERLAAESLDESNLAPAHGGFCHGQMIANGDSLTIVGWENLCLAPRALDAATFLARLRRAPLRRPGRARAVEELADMFRAAFLRRGSIEVRELAVFEAMALTAAALRAATRPGRRPLPRRARRFLAAAEQALDGT